MLSFDWQVSSESGFDWLIATLNDVEILKESGESSGSYQYAFTSSGDNTLEVKYTKDGSVDGGEDFAKVYNIALTSTPSIASGTCGENLTWRLTEDYELIIEGTGAMYEYYYGEAPWYEYHDIIENVVLLEGVISIGRNAFINCGNLIDIIIPKSVVSIETLALATCNSLISIVVHEENPIYDSRDNCNAIIETKSNTLIAGCNNTTIPQSVTSIGRYAFAGCCNINTITIPEKVKYIEDYAFNYCDNLVSITIPAGVVNIGKGILSYCRKLESIIVNEENPAYDSRNDCNAIIDKESNALIAGCATTVFPEDVVSIGESAFAYHMITDITIPKEVTNIGNWAFDNCSKLSSITLYAETPPLLGGGVFDFIDFSIPIYVPYTSISAYKSSIWGVFTNIRPLFNEYPLPYLPQATLRCSWITMPKSPKMWRYTSPLV